MAAVQTGRAAKGNGCAAGASIKGRQYSHPMSMTYQETMEYIHSLLRFGSKPGLARIGRLLELLGNPQKNLRFVHIAGTNGKGSTTAMIASVLTTAGYKTGMYTSPFVIDFRERMQIDGEMIGMDALAEQAGRVRQAADRLAETEESATEFEIVTAIALCWFEASGCDIVCLEVGLGGRFDATNIIEPPLVSVITSISLDHTQVLGDNVAQIAYEKCGIIKPLGITVTYPDQDPQALTVIMQRAFEENNTLIRPNLSAAEILSSDLYGTVFRYDRFTLRIPLVGRHQVANAITAVETIGALKSRGFMITDANIMAGLQAVKWPARFEVLSANPFMILDGAHNEAGVAALADNLKLLVDRDVTAVVGMLADKEVENSLRHILPMCKRVIAVTPLNPRAMPAMDLKAIASKWCGSVSADDSIEHGIRRALRESGEQDLILIFGSLFLAGDARRMVLQWKQEGSL